MTQKLLAFSRKQVLQANQVDVASVLDSLVALIRRVIGENITVTTHADDNLWPILADPVQVEQSLVNLAINARDAMPNGGTLQITARNAPRPKGERRPDGEVKPGDYVQITVTDTGIGMDEVDAHADVRAVLYDQAARARHRARAVHGVRIRAPVRRLDRACSRRRGKARRSNCCCRARPTRAGHAQIAPSL